MKVVILAGGKGTRLAPYTTVFPKPLMPIGDVPILQLVIERMKKHGLSDITLAVGYLSELIKAFFGDGSKYGVRISYSMEEKPLGTAGPLALVKDIHNSPFLTMNGDILTSLDFSEFIKHHKNSGAAASIAVNRRTVDINYGVIETDTKGRLVKYVEKPQINYQVSMGINIFEPEVLNYIPKGKKFDIPDLIAAIIAKGMLVNCYPFNGYWLDIGRHDDYKKALEGFEKVKHEFQ